MTYVLSTFILLLLGYGLWKRRQPNIHVPVMLIAFVLDVALVLYIELSRHAVETAVHTVQAPAGHGLLLFHVAISLAVLVAYVVLIWTGFRIVGGRRDVMKLHRNIAGLFVILRLANYVTSFMV